MKHLYRPGRAAFMLGGQWGSEGKGCAAAYLTKLLCESGRMFDIVTANNGAQSGHTSIHNGKKRVAFHLPTSALIARDYGRHPMIYLNGGAIIDPEVLEQEVQEFDINRDQLFIHPFAAVITPECKEAERRGDSAQTKIASTRKGVGEALSRKVLRSGVVAKDHPYLSQFVDHHIDLNRAMFHDNAAVLVEVPQGLGLGVDAGFYPHTTSRNCTVMQAAADAGIHPRFYGGSMMVLRTYPIRVGNIVEHSKEGHQTVAGMSGGCYEDQHEISWPELGVEAEITTVTKRVRRVFTFSRKQLYAAMVQTLPEVVMLTFCNYPRANVNQIAAWISEIAHELDMPFHPQIWYQYGPGTDDITDHVK